MCKFHLLADFRVLIIKSRKLVWVKPCPTNFVNMVPKMEPINSKFDVR